MGLSAGARGASVCTITGGQWPKGAYAVSLLQRGTAALSDSGAIGMRCLRLAVRILTQAGRSGMGEDKRAVQFELTP